MSDKVFIIGNGFDVDLGLLTKYSDFYRISIQNNFWPFANSTSGLGAYLNHRVEKENWLDLESALYKYASASDGVAVPSSEGFYPVGLDKEDFETLISCLSGYLKRIVWEKGVNDKSVAKDVFGRVLDRGDYAIYSFNYTNLRSIAARLFKGASYYNDFEFEFDYTPVHGTLKDNNIIVGVNSDARLIEGYDFLRKIDQPTYCSNNLLQDLDNAKEVTFFGLSMGAIDYPYFRVLFDGICSGIVPSSEKKAITLFTYDEKSRMQILKQLRDLTGTDIHQIKSNCQFRMIRTSLRNDADKHLLDRWLSDN